VKERIELLEQVVAQYQRRLDDIAAACCSEMGAPIGLAKAAQSPAGLGHFMATLEALRSYQFEEIIDATTVAYEPVGVCGLITPWNWPLNQIAAKVAPALATGCTMVLKPSELAPLNAIIVAEVLHEAGVPAGVFNLINGDGAVVGAALAKHPGVDMVSFTGSTRAGIEVAKNAAVTVKRVTQELGGKSANIVLDDADLAEVISRDMQGMCVNTGQSCNAGSRFLVPKEKMHQAAAFAKTAAESVVVGDPETDGTAMGPLVSQLQYDKVQRLIEQAIDEGANLVCGGLGRPAGLNVGYYVQPTVFSDVTNDMTIAREEIFGPVITLIGYDSEENAIDIANDTVYGLSGYVSSPDQTRASRVARRLRTGMVHINGAGLDNRAPFGGYKQSGNGREFAGHGIRDFLEAKSIFGDNSGRN
jgi:aldehyde dehydrogenase (NAD+)